MNALIDGLQPVALSIFRVISAALFMQHGLVKHFAFPMPYAGPKFEPYGMLWWAGALEIVTGILLILGLFTRWTAFLACGLMAFAYFIGHAPRGFYPIVNGGNLAIMYCFAFFYLFFAGGGSWSLDSLLRRKN